MVLLFLTRFLAISKADLLSREMGVPFCCTKPVYVKILLSWITYEVANTANTYLASAVDRATIFVS